MRRAIKCPSVAGGGKAGEKKVVTQSVAAPRDEGKLQPPGRFDWWSPELQRALDILAEPIYCGMKVQIVGQAGCGYHPATADPDELERFAREVGYDASFSLVTASGRFPVPLGPPSSGNGNRNSPTRAAQGRAACPIPVVERNSR